MTNEEIQQRLRELIAEVVEVEPELVQDQVNIMTDLGADSMRMIEILARAEDEFGITIDQSNLGRMVSLDDIREIVQDALAATA